MLNNIVVEYNACKEDFHYFSEKYLDLKFKKFVTTSNNKRLFICARQVGKTTYACAYVLWKSLFSDNIPSNGGYHAYMSFNHLATINAKACYARLKEKLGKSPFGMLLLESQGRVEFSTCTEGATCGRSFETIVIDEAALVRDLDNMLTILYPIIATAKDAELIMLTSVAPGNMTKLMDLKSFDRITVKHNFSDKKLEEIKKAMNNNTAFAESYLCEWSN